MQAPESASTLRLRSSGLNANYNFLVMHFLHQRVYIRHQAKKKASRDP
jgi:hypothetical protein